MKKIISAIGFTLLLAMSSLAFGSECKDKNSAEYKLLRIEMLSIKAKLFLKNGQNLIAEDLIEDIVNVASDYNIENEDKVNFCRRQK